MQLARLALVVLALAIVAGCGGSSSPPTTTAAATSVVGLKPVTAAFRAEGITLRPLIGSTKELLMGYAIYRSTELIPGSVGVFRSTRVAVARGDLFCAGDDCYGIRNVVVALKRTVSDGYRRRVQRALARIRSAP